MKIRTFALTLALAGAPVLLAAQQQTPQQGRGDQHGAWQDRRNGQRGERQGGYEALLRYRQQLGLTDAQVSRLQSIEQRLQSQNAPLMQRIQAARQQAGLPDFRARRGQGQQGWARGQGRGEDRAQRGEDRAQRGEDRAQRGEDRAQRGEGRAQRGERPQLTEQQRQAMQRFREQMKPVQDQLRQNRQAALRDAQAVLTPHQRQQVQQLIREHRQQGGRRGGQFRGQRRGEGQRGGQDS